MGRRSYPPLSPSEVVAILERLGFSLKRQDGSHAQYVRPADETRPKSIVTVDMAEKDFGDFLMRSMIRQSNHSRAEFYGATKRSARKASLPLTREDGDSSVAD
jgi:predicted RNA binding protein YcfA (HicA-like mRNA interferase family)